MRNKRWTNEELALLGTAPDAEIARKLNRTENCVRLKRREKGVTRVAPPKVEAEETYDTDRAKAANDQWRQRYGELNNKYKKALQEASVVDQLVEDIKAMAPMSYSPAPVVRYFKPRVNGSTPQSAMLLLSDTHVGKVVTPEQTLEFGEYNFPVFLARLKYLEESILSILKNHTTHETPELVVAMLGDMLDGALAHAAEAAQHATLFAQFYGAGHALAQFLRSLAAHVPKIRVETVVGNHTRWQNQKKMPTENRFSNLDMFLYALVQALTRDIRNIAWNLNSQPFQIFQVQGWVFHAAHGDHLRGGDKALGFPAHATGREISTKTQLFTKYARQAPHYYVCGHLHRDFQIPHALGDFVVNGGFPGLDTYSLTGNFNPVDPTQRFFFVHPKFGKTAEYKLSLKFAKATDPLPYEVPGGFSIV